MAKMGFRFHYTAKHISTKNTEKKIIIISTTPKNHDSLNVRCLAYELRALPPWIASCGRGHTSAHQRMNINVNNRTTSLCVFVNISRQFKRIVARRQRLPNEVICNWSVYRMDVCLDHCAADQILSVVDWLNARIALIRDSVQISSITLLLLFVIVRIAHAFAAFRRLNRQVISE